MGLDVTQHGEEAYAHDEGAILVLPEVATPSAAPAVGPPVAGRRPRMKLVVAVVRPDKLSDVLEALFRAEVRGLTISRVQGHGGELERVENYRGTTVKMELSEKVRLEIGVSDHFVKPTVDAIIASARTGDVGRREDLRRARGEGLPHPDGRGGPGRGHADRGGRAGVGCSFRFWS